MCCVYFCLLVLFLAPAAETNYTGVGQLPGLRGPVAGVAIGWVCHCVKNQTGCQKEKKYPLEVTWVENGQFSDHMLKDDYSKIRALLLGFYEGGKDCSARRFLEDQFLLCSFFGSLVVSTPKFCTAPPFEVESRLFLLLLLIRELALFRRGFRPYFTSPYKHTQSYTNIIFFETWRLLMPSLRSTGVWSDFRGIVRNLSGRRSQKHFLLELGFTVLWEERTWKR